MSVDVVVAVGSAGVADQGGLDGEVSPLVAAEWEQNILCRILLLLLRKERMGISSSSSSSYIYYQE